MTGAEVWGHEDARHTTGNPELVEVADTNKDANAERYQLRDVLARKFLVYVDSSLTEPQMGYLDKALKISKWINSSMQFRGKGFTQTDNYQVFVEEISFMGFGGTLELVGGVLILVGLFTRATAFILSGMMAVAYFMAHASGGFLPLVNKGELAVLYCFVFLFLASAGPGAFSLDGLLRGRSAVRAEAI